LLSAFEQSLRQGCKDEPEWRREHGKLYAEPPSVKQARREEVRRAVQNGEPRSAVMSADSVSALLASMTATDAKYGAL